MLTRPFLAILFLACLIDSGQTLTLSHDNQILFDLIFQQDSIKLFSWNMGSSYCRAGETSPKCDSYIKDSVNKLISLGDKYDVICLQGAPKYYKLQQKDLADKLINDFVLKYRYSIVRSGRTDLAILSKFPILNTTDIQVSHYAAKSVSFWAGGSKYQVVNIQNLNYDFSQDFVARKEDIKKILQWMSSNENKGDVNILTGYFYMNYGNIENVIMDVKPFGLNGLPPRSCPGPSYCTLTWGETGWPYTMEKMSNENVQYGMIYTKSFKITDYPPANRADLMTIRTQNKREQNTR